MQMSPSEFRIAFNAALIAPKLPLTFKPYSLRRGGATAHFQQHGKIDLTTHIGHWAENRTVRNYIDTALLVLTAMQYLETSKLSTAASAFLNPVR